MEDIPLKKVLSNLKKIDLKKYFAYYQTLLAIKIESIEELRLRQIQIKRQEKFNDRFSKLDLAKAKLRVLSRCLMIKEIEFLEYINKISKYIFPI